MEKQEKKVVQTTILLNEFEGRDILKCLLYCRHRLVRHKKEFGIGKEGLDHIISSLDSLLPAHD